MKKKLLAVMCMILSACNQHSYDTTEPVEITKDSIVLDTTKLSVSGIKKASKDSSVRSLYPGNDTMITRLSIDSLNKQLYVPVHIVSGTQLFAELFSIDPKANIRINQIEMPDSTFDGPFGRNMQYKIKSPGNYKIIIGENLMAGDKWKGDLKLKAWMK